MSRPVPYLSIVSTGRNDGYGGDFIERWLRTLDFNERQLAARGVDVEFVFVEWAPPEGVPLLAEIVRTELPRVCSTLRAFVVDEAYQDALTLNPRVRYLEFIAKNVGIRRARGAFVLATNVDVYFGRHVLDRFTARALEQGRLYRARRIDLKRGLDLSTLDWDVLEDERNYESGLKPLKPPLYSGGTGDFVLLDARTFRALRGFNEVYRVAKIGIDRNFLVKASSAGVPIADIGGPVYHVNHVGSYRLSKGMYRERQDEAPYGDRRWPSSAVVYENSDAWGLASAPEMTMSEGMMRVLFDWSAVAPIVDLARVIAATAPSAPDDSEP